MFLQLLESTTLRVEMVNSQEMIKTMQCEPMNVSANISTKYYLISERRSVLVTVAESA